MSEMTAQQVREVIGDGNFGGDYQKPDEMMNELWEVAVAETREMLEGHWKKLN